MRNLVFLLVLIFSGSYGHAQVVQLAPGNHGACRDPYQICSSSTTFEIEAHPSQRSGTPEIRTCLWLRLCSTRHLDDFGITTTISSSTTPEASISAFLVFEDDFADCGIINCPDPVTGMISLDAGSVNTGPGPGGNYLILLVLTGGVENFTIDVGYTPCCGDAPPPCPDCLSSFSPLPGQQYRISAWVSKEGLAPGATTIFENGSPYIKVEVPPSPQLVQGLRAMSPVIDGWQLIEGTFTMPPASTTDTELHISLGSNDGTVFFDDVRVIPHLSSVKSFVYDPQNLRFVAELDDRHFATFYEYDPEGRLVRVKKETERGIMTLKEIRQHSSKLP